MAHCTAGARLEFADEGPRVSTTLAEADPSLTANGQPVRSIPSYEVLTWTHR